MLLRLRIEVYNLTIYTSFSLHFNIRPPSPPPLVVVVSAMLTVNNTLVGVEFDASDPDLGLAARLSQLGPVVPNPTQSNSSTFNHSKSSVQFQPSASTPSQSVFPNERQNPAVSLLTARYRLAEEAELEFSNTGRKGSEGRQFLDVVTIRQILVLREEEGLGSGEIERRLGLRKGVVDRLGKRGLVEAGS